MPREWRSTVILTEPTLFTLIGLSLKSADCIWRLPLILSITYDCSTTFGLALALQSATAKSNSLQSHENLPKCISTMSLLCGTSRGPGTISYWSEAVSLFRYLKSWQLAGWFSRHVRHFMEIIFSHTGANTQTLISSENVLVCLISQLKHCIYCYLPVTWPVCVFIWSWVCGI